MTRNTIRNAIEDHAAEAYARLVTHFEDFCGCETCRLDVLVYALNLLAAPTECVLVGAPRIEAVHDLLANQPGSARLRLPALGSAILRLKVGAPGVGTGN